MLFTTTSNDHYKYSRTEINQCFTLHFVFCGFFNYFSNFLIHFNEELSHWLVHFYNNFHRFCTDEHVARVAYGTFLQSFYAIEINRVSIGREEENIEEK